MSENNFKSYKTKLNTVFAITLICLVSVDEFFKNPNVFITSLQKGILWKLGFGPFSTIISLAIENLVSSKIKDKIVLFGRNLPGCNLKRLAQKDSILTEEILINYFGAIPISSKEQNTLWYKVYKTVQNNPKILAAHQEYLTLRDLTYLVAISLALGLGASIFYDVPKVVLFFLGIGYPLLSIVTYNKAERFAGITLNEGINI